MRTDKLERMAYRLLSDPALFSRFVVGRPLRPYQLEPARAILGSVLARRGDQVSVMMARQAGKNELSAQLEAYLLNLHAAEGGTIVKAAPTYMPQIVTSRLRLESVLENPLDHGRWRADRGGVRLGRARCQFLSAEPGASVVGATASILLEVDETQDVDPDKHDRDFAPMAASTNATRVYYGTAWQSDDLLQRVKEENLRRADADGRPRHFEYPWWVIAEWNEEYGRYVEGERARLGDNHPLFKTQYRLIPLGGESGFLSVQQRELVRGDHPRLHRPLDGAVYVAGVDLAGPDEVAADELVRRAKPRKDSTVVTIARVTPTTVVEGIVEPRLEVVEHCWWTGRGHREQYETLLATLREVWGCRRVVVDASGLGAGVADFLKAALGEIVVPFAFTAESKSRLGFNLLGAVNGGRFRMYREPETEDGCAAEFWRQCAACRHTVRRGQQLAFWVPPAEGHDDFVVSAALCAWAARELIVPPAAAIIPPASDYADGRY